MSDSSKERKPKRPPVESAGDDPWAKWRQPDAPAAPAPRPAPAVTAPVETKVEKPVEPELRERPTGTLRPNKDPDAPPRVPARKPHSMRPAPAPLERVRESAPVRAKRPAMETRRPVAKEPRPVPREPQQRHPDNHQEGVRLSKVMSERAMCSRREADLWI